MWIISKSHREKNFFFDIFAIHSSSRHEKRCQISVRLFSLFRGSIDQQCHALVTFVFLGEVMAPQFCFEIYWPLVRNILPVIRSEKDHSIVWDSQIWYRIEYLSYRIIHFSQGISKSDPFGFKGPFGTWKGQIDLEIKEGNYTIRYLCSNFLSAQIKF